MAFSQTKIMEPLITTAKKIIYSLDWDKFVSAIYEKPYCFQQQDGCKSRGIVPVNQPEDFEDTTLPEIINGEEMGVSFKTWLECDPSEPSHFKPYELELWWERNFYPSLDMIINDLHERGLLDAGDYVIEIDW